MQSPLSLLNSRRRSTGQVQFSCETCQSETHRNLGSSLNISQSMTTVVQSPTDEAPSSSPSQMSSVPPPSWLSVDGRMPLPPSSVEPSAIIRPHTQSQTVSDKSLDWVRSFDDDMALSRPLPPPPPPLPSLPPPSRLSADGHVPSPPFLPPPPPELSSLESSAVSRPHKQRYCVSDLQMKSTVGNVLLAVITRRL